MARLQGGAYIQRYAQENNEYKACLRRYRELVTMKIKVLFDWNSNLKYIELTPVNTGRPTTFFASSIISISALDFENGNSNAYLHLINNTEILVKESYDSIVQAIMMHDARWWLEDD